jgi:large repetitive protein
LAPQQIRHWFPALSLVAAAAFLALALVLLGRAAGARGEPLANAPSTASDPAISLRKLTNGRDVSGPPGPIILAGATVGWTYHITNTGNITLTQVSLSDDGGFNPACGQSTLAAGEAMVCFFEGTAVADQYSNTATVSGQSPVGGPATGQDTSYYFGAQPALALEKRTNGQDADEPPGPYIVAGETVVWTFVVTNTGNITLSDITVVDNQVAGVQCPKSSLDAGEGMTCQAEGKATDGPHSNLGQATGRVLLDSGQFAEATAQDPSHYFGVVAYIGLEKFTNNEPALYPPGPLVPVGEQVSWTYFVANQGNATLSNITLSDDRLGPIANCPLTTLNVSESMICQASGVAEAGQYSNTAYVQAVSAAGNTVTNTAVSHYYGSAPALALQKLVNGQDAAAPPGPFLLVGGSPATFTYIITNTGSVGLSAVALSDDRLGPIDCPKNALADGEAMVCEASDDVVSDQYTNLATVTGTPEVGSQVQTTGQAYYFGADPAVAIAKLTNGFDADEPPGPYILVGDPVTWSYVITNTGNVTLTNLVVTDDQGVTVECQESSLAPGQAITCSGSGLAQMGLYANTGSVSGASPVEGAGASAADSSHYFGARPELTVAKATNGEDADSPPGPSIIVGDPVNWTYQVHNTGNITLTQVTVTDDQGLAVSCPQSTLGPDELITCTASGAAVSGQYANMGTATGLPPGGLEQVEAQDPSHYRGISPAIVIQLRTNGVAADSPPGLYLEVGQPITWTYVLTNTGDATLSNVTVVDDQQGTITCPGGPLSPGSTMSCQATGSAAPDQYAALATVTSNPVGLTAVISATGATHYFGALLGLEMAKETQGQAAPAPPGPLVLVGEAVKWTYSLTNTGNVELTGVSVADDQGEVVSCPQSSLAGGTSMVCTASGTAAAGQYSNTATAGGTPPGGLPAQQAQDTSHYYGAGPGIALAKRVNGLDAGNPPGPYLLPGETVQWHFVVTNTGNITLTGIAVQDNQLGPIACPGGELGPGAAVTCQAQGTVAVGQYVNTATAQATPPVGPALEAEDTAYYFGITPGLAIVKRTNGHDAPAPPGPSIFETLPVTWTYAITNTGNIFLEDVLLVDEPQGEVACPKTTLDAGEGMSCSLIGLAQVGQYSNEATVSGRPPAGPQVSASDTSHYLGLSTTPSIDIQKYTNGSDADIVTGPLIAVGDPVAWTYVVVNTGQVPLESIAVTDSDPGVTVSCPRSSLDSAPDGMTCTAAGTAEPGQYANLGSVTAVAAVGGDQVSDSDPSHYFGSAPALALETRFLGQDAGTPPGVYVLAGQPVTWTYTVTNTGNVSLTGLAVSEGHGPAVTCQTTSLDLGASTTCSASGTAAVGQQSAAATATASSAIGQVVQAADDTHYFGATLDMAMSKYTNGQAAAQPPGPFIPAGQPVTWTYEVTNNSNVRLSGLQVVDDPAGSADCPQTFLDPGQSLNCQIQGTAEPDQYGNKALATAQPPGGLPAQQAGDLGYYFGSAPELVLEKATNGLDADTPPGPYIQVGSPVTWTYAVTNTGNVTLTQVAVTDDQVLQVNCLLETLAPGQSMTCTASGYAALGQYANEGRVEGLPPAGLAVSATDLSHYFGGQPAIALQKRVQGEDADTPPGPRLEVGQQVLWTYEVTNTGNTTLSNIVVADDDPAISLDCPSSLLAPAQAMTCEASGTVVLGPYKNRAVATAQPPGGLDPVAAEDLSHYFGALDQPSITLEKRTNGHDADEAPGPFILFGQPVTWTYLVANTGNDTVTNIALTDSRGLQVECPSDSLDPLSYMVCHAEGAAEVGQYDNLGTVQAQPLGGGAPVSDTDPSHYFGSQPLIGLEMRANGQLTRTPPGPYLPVGSTVEWSYLVENLGNVLLTGIQLTDDQQGAVDCPATELEPGESMTCLAQAPALPGPYASRAEVSAQAPVGPDVTAEDVGHYYGSAPAIELEKLVIGGGIQDEDADTPPGPFVPVGASLTFHYVISNSGNVPLAGINLLDDNLDLHVQCPGNELEAGQAMICQATAPAQPGQHSNLATVTAQDPTGAEVSDQDPVFYFGFVEAPALALEKRVNGLKAPTAPGPYLVAGSPVTWSYLVSNAGNQPLIGITVDDGEEGPVSCPSAELSLGESMICQLDGAAVLGPYQNQATATASYTPPDGPTTVLTATAVSHYQGAQIGVGLEKYTNGHDADEPPGPVIVAGQPVTWTYAVTNLSTVELLDVRVSDSDPLLDVLCPKNQLAPGEQMICLATGLSLGQPYANTATVTAWPVGGLPQVSDTDLSHYSNLARTYLPLIAR